MSRFYVFNVFFILYLNVFLHLCFQHSVVVVVKDPVERVAALPCEISDSAPATEYSVHVTNMTAVNLRLPRTSLPQYAKQVPKEVCQKAAPPSQTRSRVVL